MIVNLANNYFVGAAFMDLPFIGFITTTIRFHQTH